jgi:rhodanese-related sulfurtransferase
VRASAFASISSQDLIRLMKQGALVLDIRKEEEFAKGHVNGAKHLSSEKILTAGDTFKRFKDKPVVVYCDSGSLAAAAVRQLNNQGFTKAFTLRGGFAAWRADNLPIAKAA